MKIAIFTICIGNSYIQQYESIFKPSVIKYCNKYNYDLHVITDYIGDQKYRNKSFISFMKMIIPYTEKAKEYDLIMVLDADVLINDNTPPFHTFDFGDKIAVVDEYTQPSYEERLEIQRKNGWEVGADQYYKLCGLNINTKHMINSGMFICKPSIHQDFFKNLVCKHIDKQYNHPRGFHYEQSVFGYELQTANLHFIIDNKWNKLWNYYKVNESEGGPLFKQFYNFYNSTYFLHMAGHVDYNLAYIFRNK
jgi:hypothetical protein